MVVFKIVFLLAAVNVVHPKPFLLKEMKIKKDFELSLKPLLKPVAFIKALIPLEPQKIKHKVEKRSPFLDADGPPLNVKSSPAPLFTVDLQKSLELRPGFSSPPPHLQEEEKSNEQPPPPVVLPIGHEKTHEEHFDHTASASKLLTKVDLGPSSVPPPKIPERNLPPHVRLTSVSPLPPPHVEHEDHPPLGPYVPQDFEESEQQLLVEPKPKVILPPVLSDKGPFYGFSKSPSVTIYGHPPPPPPPYLLKSTPSPPGNKNEGTLDSFFEPPTTQKLERPVHFPSEPPRYTPPWLNGATGQGLYTAFARPPPAGIKEERLPPHYGPVSPHEFTGQSSSLVPELAPPPPAGIQEKPAPHLTTVLPPVPTVQEGNRGSMFTDIFRVDEINAYIKAIDALPIVKPPLEETIRGNSLDPVGPKLTADTKVEPSTFAKGSRLALYFGNILLQVMSQAIGSARTAIGQYSMPSMI